MLKCPSQLPNCLKRAEPNTVPIVFKCVLLSSPHLGLTGTQSQFLMNREDTVYIF